MGRWRQHDAERWTGGLREAALGRRAAEAVDADLGVCARDATGSAGAGIRAQVSAETIAHRSGADRGAEALIAGFAGGAGVAAGPTVLVVGG